MFSHLPVYPVSPSIMEFLVVHLFLLLEYQLFELFEVRDCNLFDLYIHITEPSNCQIFVECIMGRSFR